MKKELFLITISIFLSTLIMGTCVYVFSWTEPTSMPSTYELPINTGTTAQTKNGGIGATIITDPDDTTYYLNPSGTTKLKNILQGAAITSSSPSGTVATVDYVSALFSGLGVIPSSTAPVNNFYWVTGDQCTCDSTDILVGRSWLAKTFIYDYAGDYCSCTTAAIFSSNPPSCQQYCNYGGYHYTLNYATLWNAALCARVTAPENPLYQGGLVYPHSEEECSSNGGAVLTVDGKKICRLPQSTCPAGWTQLSNWSTTTAVSTCPLGGGGSCGSYCCSTTNHAWSNTAQESCGWSSCPDVNCCMSNWSSYAYATITQIGCY